MGSLRYRWCGPGLDCPGPRGEVNCIYVLWHQRFLAFTHTHSFREVRALISRHGDGEMISRITEGLGFKPVRGSSKRGGSRAMRELISECDGGHDYAILVDGPRGPRYEFKPGSIYLASRTGLPIVPITMSFARAWQFRSWDRFMLPRPFTRALIRVGAEVHVPPELSTADLEIWRRELEETLRQLTAEADEQFEPLWKEAVRTPHRRPPVTRRERRARRVEAATPV